MQSVKRITGGLGVYSCYRTASVDLCLSSWPSLQLICPPRRCVSFFFFYFFLSTLQILFQAGRRGVRKTLLAVLFSPPPSPPYIHLHVLWCSATGNKTGGASPSCGLMQYYIVVQSQLSKLRAAIRAFDVHREALESANDMRGLKINKSVRAPGGRMRRSSWGMMRSYVAVLAHQ